jgi:NAD(P)-dependent dehydrogenase (short-subunit alcohol dehydrogenase family)
MPGQLEGQVAIVTGGGRGFGQAIALGLAEADASVAVTARTAGQLAQTVQMIESAGGKALAVVADVSVRADVERVVAETEAKLGPVTLLVSNAGVSDPVGPLWELDPDLWRRTQEVNLMGAVYLIRAAMPAMVERGTGRVIIVARGAGVFAGPYDSAYRISKTGLIRLAEILALEAKDHGISVFSIHPGVANTAIHESATRTEAGRKWLPHFGEMAARGATDIKLAANCCVFLASGAADGLSGRYINATGDYESIAAQADQIREKGSYVLRLAGVSPPPSRPA